MAALANLTREERSGYVLSRERERDVAAALESSETRGKAKANRATAARVLQLGYSIQEAAEIWTLPVSEVEAIAAELQNYRE